MHDLDVCIAWLLSSADEKHTPPVYHDLVTRLCLCRI